MAVVVRVILEQLDFEFEFVSGDTDTATNALSAAANKVLLLLQFLIRLNTSWKTSGNKAIHQV